MGAGLLQFYPQWRAITEDTWVRNVVIFYPSISWPPLFTSPANINLPGDPEKYCILDLEVTHMLVKQAIEPQFSFWPFRSV